MKQKIEPYIPFLRSFLLLFPAWYFFAIVNLFFMMITNSEDLGYILSLALLGTIVSIPVIMRLWNIKMNRIKKILASFFVILLYSVILFFMLFLMQDLLFYIFIHDLYFPHLFP